MANYNSRPNKKMENFFRILIIVLCSALFIFGIVGVADAFRPRDTYSDINLQYKVGAIVTNSNGAGILDTNCKTALYSTEAVKCTGFEVLPPEFSTAVNYEIHYYTENNIYIGHVVKSSTGYLVPSGKMPVLKAYVGNIEDKAYETANAVLDNDGNEQQASYIRIVLRAVDADNRIFENPLTVLSFDWAFKLRATTHVATNDTVVSPADSSNN